MAIEAPASNIRSPLDMPLLRKDGIKGAEPGEWEGGGRSGPAPQCLLCGCGDGRLNGHVGRILAFRESGFGYHYKGSRAFQCGANMLRSWYQVQGYRLFRS